MLNIYTAVGRLVKKPELEKTENGKDVAKITLAIPRSYKNEEGIYDTDFIDCVVIDSITRSKVEYCEKGDLISIKGTIQSRDVLIGDVFKYKKMEIICESVSFLSAKKKGED